MSCSVLLPFSFEKKVGWYFAMQTQLTGTWCTPQSGLNVTVLLQSSKGVQARAFKPSTSPVFLERYIVSFRIKSDLEEGVCWLVFVLFFFHLVKCSMHTVTIVTFYITMETVVSDRLSILINSQQSAIECPHERVSMTNTSVLTIFIVMYIFH